MWVMNAICLVFCLFLWSRFSDKTCNSWTNRASFVKSPGKYDLLLMDYEAKVGLVCVCVCVRVCACVHVCVWSLLTGNTGIMISIYYSIHCGFCL